jgi:hypothetical protein
MKYKVGDYVQRPVNSVHLRVCAAYDGEVPLYALLSPKTTQPDWISELELDMLEFRISHPELEKWRGAKEGDIVNDGNGFCKVLARIGDVVVLSRSPVPRDEFSKLEDLADQLNSLEPDTKATSEMALSLQPKTLHEAHRMVGPGSCEWRTVEFYALMSWELLRE